MKSAADLVRELGKEEAKIKTGDIQFVAPVFNNRMVVTSLHGLTYKFIIPKIEPCWCFFRATSYERAIFTRAAQIDEIESYLKQCVPIRLVTTYKEGNIYYALPQKNNKLKLPYTNPVPMYLTDDMVMDFDTVVGRFDGENFWFGEIDYKTDSVKTEYLREAFSKLTPPKDLRYSGLTIEEKTAYAFRYATDKKIKEEMAKRMKKAGLETAINHAGGKLVSYHERSDSFSVTYTVDGQRHTSYVTKDPSHSVITAGICLNGRDRDFDLASLIDVMREGQREGLINRM